MTDSTDEYGQLPSAAALWHFPARVDRVVDGDTIDVSFDLGMRIQATRQRVRLYGVDTAEIYGVAQDSDEYERGIEHNDFVEEWLTDAAERSSGSEFPLRCYTLKGVGKYGRWLVDILDDDGLSLVGALYAEYGDEVSY